MVAVVTTDRKCHKESLELAAEMSAKLGLRQVPRQKESVAELMERYQADAVLVALQKELRLHTEAGELFFHPNMSQLRLKNLRLGEKDHMTEQRYRPGGQSPDCGSDRLRLAAFPAGQLSSVCRHAAHQCGQ